MLNKHRPQGRKALGATLATVIWGSFVILVAFGTTGCSDLSGPTHQEKLEPTFDESGVTNDGVEQDITVSDPYAYVGSVSLPNYPHPTVVTVLVSGQTTGIRNIWMWGMPQYEIGDVIGTWTRAAPHHLCIAALECTSTTTGAGQSQVKAAFPGARTRAAILGISR